MSVAETIWSQINMHGNAIPMSWGSHALKKLPSGLIDNGFDCINGGIQFMVHGALFTGHVRVILNGLDTYDVHIGRVRKGVWKEHKTLKDIYCDVLTEVIDQTVETPDNAVAEEEPPYTVTLKGYDGVDEKWYTLMEGGDEASATRFHNEAWACTVAMHDPEGQERDDCGYYGYDKFKVIYK